MWNTFTQRLPSHPPDKNGWPWAFEVDSSQTGSDLDFPWPKISIVTPSFNQGEFIEETIRSVLLQGYPNLEYLVMDGGSADETVAILKKYEPWITDWVSEKDRGQPHAINKGWASATGDIIAWINSDDWYQPGALLTVARFFQSNPNCLWLAGAVDNCSEPGRVDEHFQPHRTSLAQCMGRKDYGFHQPAMFWHRKLINSVGPLDETLHFSFDHDFWIRSLLLKFEPACIQTCLAGFRWHPESKTRSKLSAFLKEDWIVFNRYRDRLSPEEQCKVRRWLLEYEAESLLISTYSLLAEHRRWKALRLLLSRLRVFPHIKPRRLGLGALYRTLVTGTPPKWFSH